MLDWFIEKAKKAEKVIRFLKALVAGLEAFQKELTKGDVEQSKESVE